MKYSINCGSDVEEIRTPMPLALDNETSFVVRGLHLYPFPAMAIVKFAN